MITLDSVNAIYSKSNKPKSFEKGTNSGIRYSDEFKLKVVDKVVEKVINGGGTRRMVALSFKLPISTVARFVENYNDKKLKDANGDVVFSGLISFGDKVKELNGIRYTGQDKEKALNLLAEGKAPLEVELITGVSQPTLLRWKKANEVKSICL